MVNLDHLTNQALDAKVCDMKGYNSVGKMQEHVWIRLIGNWIFYNGKEFFYKNDRKICFQLNKQFQM